MLFYCLLCDQRPATSEYCTVVQGLCRHRTARIGFHSMHPTAVQCRACSVVVDRSISFRPVRDQPDQIGWYSSCCCCGECAAPSPSGSGRRASQTQRKREEDDSIRSKGENAKKRMGGTKGEIKGKRMCSGISPRSTASFQLYSGACTARFLMYCCAIFFPFSFPALSTLQTVS